MKLININGGLGNQLFQYFFGKYIVGEKDDFSFLINDIKNYSSHQGLEIQKIIDEDIILLHQPKNFFELTSSKKLFNKFSGLKRSWFRNYFENSDNLITEKEVQFNKFFFGYWQNINYYKSKRNKILKDINFILDNENLKQASEIKKMENSVSIHIRRGDYLKSNAHLNLDSKYYFSAIEYIKKEFFDPKFFIFSDDIDWCRKFLEEYKRDCFFVEVNSANKSYLDMKLMSLCKINIIANSTFSWWSGFLNTTPDKLIIVPSRWYKNKKNYLYSKEMLRI